MDKINNIKRNYYLDSFSLLLYILVSFSFPTIYKVTIPLIIGITLFQIYRLKSNKITSLYFSNTYFNLLVFSLVFFRSVHTIILVINICFHLYLIFKNNPIPKVKITKPEAYVFIFFGLILLNYLIFVPNLRGVETYLYLILYPLLFLCIKIQPFFLSIYKAINIYITAIIIATIYLITINIFFDKLTLSTNTFFSDYLGIIHVYFGIFIGLAISFLLALNTQQKKYVTRNSDYFIITFLIIILVYIGARMALLGVFLIMVITIYKKIQLAWYNKSMILAIVMVGMFVISYNTIPRVKRGLDSIENIYASVKTKNEEDLIKNSWRNMYSRYLVTKYTIREIKENYLLGIGNKNVKDQISTRITNDGYKYFEPINTHNQYLHFLVGMGIPSFLFFIWMLVYFYKNYSNTSFALYFLIFFLIIMLTESILVRVKGISVFYLFYLIFSYQEKKSFHV